ncbi:GTP-binding protein [Candidatus Marsarchaeota archaeon]|nr:GTP-binding protein [Candidatus Marsarchaeota archaeon]MCL5404829.1 GTP-binding protein [Candidatus Marsarchaeota archaeon]
MSMRHITILGHKDHGKSTLIGSILIATGSASPERVEEAKTASARLKRKFEPAYMLDSFAEEREGGLTIDTTRAQFEYMGRAFELIDVPGHEELIKNMISGASYADTAILVVSAAPKEGIKSQTKRHVFLANMLGISSFIVAVNKMDMAKYSERTFENIRSGLEDYFASIGIRNANVHYVPISAYNMENITKPSSSMPWYKGMPLLQLLFKNNEGARKAPARILIQGPMGKDSIEAYAGKMLSGSVGPGAKLNVVPAGKSVTVKRLVVKGRDASLAKAGESIVLYAEPRIALPRGCILSSTKRTRSASIISAKVFFVKNFGKSLELRLNGISVKASLQTDKFINTATGKPIESKTARALNAMECILKLSEKVAAEEFTDFKGLSRFLIYSGKGFAGIGTIEKIIG